MIQFVLASSNEGKIREISQLTSQYNISIVPQSAFHVVDADEIGQTFIENALIKARHAAAMTNLPAIADDSGLVVPSLQGQPGIYSARYAGREADTSKNMAKLLANLKGYEGEQRRAFYYCVIVLLQHADDPCPIVCEGIWYGSILSAPRGQKGFGYDPVFFDDSYELSAAELDPQIKNHISHRGQAMQKLLIRLKPNYP